MRLGSETGSLINHVMSDGNGLTPTVGMGATILGWTDRYPATVVDVQGDVIFVQEDTATRLDKNGLSEAQDYSYSPNPCAKLRTFKRDKTGRWRACDMSTAKRWVFQPGGKQLILGRREKYHDYSF
jgi:hypothetical protein